MGDSEVLETEPDQADALVAARRAILGGRTAALKLGASRPGDEMSWKIETTQASSGNTLYTVLVMPKDSDDWAYGVWEPMTSFSSFDEAQAYIVAKGGTPVLTRASEASKTAAPRRREPQSHSGLAPNKWYVTDRAGDISGGPYDTSESANMLRSLGPEFARIYQADATGSFVAGGTDPKAKVWYASKTAAEALSLDWIPQNPNLSLLQGLDGDYGWAYTSGEWTVHNSAGSKVAGGEAPNRTMVDAKSMVEYVLKRRASGEVEPRFARKTSSADYDAGYANGKRARDAGDDPGVLQTSNEMTDYVRGYWDGYGLKERTAATRKYAWTIDQVRSVVERQTYASVDGQTLDLFSASGLVQIHDALSAENQAKLTSMPLAQAVDIAFQLINKKSSKTASDFVTDFFAAVDATGEQIAGVQSVSEVLGLAGDFWGGDGSDLMGILSRSGWFVMEAEADYHWSMQAPDGSILGYIEGDLRDYTEYQGRLAARKTAAGPYHEWTEVTQTVGAPAYERTAYENQHEYAKVTVSPFQTEPGVTSGWMATVTQTAMPGYSWGTIGQTSNYGPFPTKEEAMKAGLAGIESRGLSSNGSKTAASAGEEISRSLKNWVLGDPKCSHTNVVPSSNAVMPFECADCGYGMTRQEAEAANGQTSMFARRKTAGLYPDESAEGVTTWADGYGNWHATADSAEEAIAAILERNPDFAENYYGIQVVKAGPRHYVEASLRTASDDVNGEEVEGLDTDQTWLDNEGQWQVDASRKVAWQVGDRVEFTNWNGAVGQAVVEEVGVNPLSGFEYVDLDDGRTVYTTGPQADERPLRLLSARSDYAHWNEDADYMWWNEEGKHESEPDEPNDYDDYNDDLDDDEEVAERQAEWAGRGEFGDYERRQMGIGASRHVAFGGSPDKWYVFGTDDDAPVSEAFDSSEAAQAWFETKKDQIASLGYDPQTFYVGTGFPDESGLTGHSSKTAASGLAEESIAYIEREFGGSLVGKSFPDDVISAGPAAVEGLVEWSESGFDGNLFAAWRDLRSDLTVEEALTLLTGDVNTIFSEGSLYGSPEDYPDDYTYLDEAEDFAADKFDADYAREKDEWEPKEGFLAAMPRTAKKAHGLTPESDLFI